MNPIPLPGQPLARAVSGAARATRWYVAGLCLLGAVRIFIGCGGLPLFHDVDEQAHFDLVHKFARGYWPLLPHETWDRETAEIEVTHGSPEFLYRPERYPGGVYPPPVWTWAASPERDDYIQRRTLARAGYENHEAHSPPVYYLAGAAWYNLGRLAGLRGAGAVYWVRFLNVAFYALLIAASHAFCQAHFSRFVALAVPALVAVFPSTVFFGITSDALSPLMVILALWLLLRWRARPAPATGFSLLVGLSAAAAFLVKLSNVAILAACGIVVALRWHQAARADTLREEWRRGSLVLLGAGLPISCWLLRNAAFLGDATGTAAKVQSLGWRLKPIGAILDHPLFSCPGQKVFWSNLVTHFYEGDMNWFGRPTMNFIPAEVFFLASFALLPVALVLAWHRRKRPAADRFPAAGKLCALVFAGSIMFLVIQSLLWDFGTGVYPSRAYPYLSSGRLISGAIVPFFALYAWSVETVFRRPKPALAAVIAVSLTMMLLAQAELATKALPSRRNWFHLFVPGNDSDARTGLGLIALHQGRFDEAAARFSAAAAANPANLVALANLGTTLAAQGDHGLAAQAFTQALSLRPESAELHNSRGAVFAAQGDWEAAAADYREAARLSPQAPLYRFPLAHALSRSGRAPDAEREYATALRLSRDWPKRSGPRAPNTRMRPDRTARMWQAAQAVQHAEQADGAGASQLEALEELAVAYSGAGRTEETIATAQIAVRVAEGNGEHDLAARLRERLRNYRQRSTID